MVCVYTTYILYATLSQVPFNFSYALHAYVSYLIFIIYISYLYFILYVYIFVFDE